MTEDRMSDYTELRKLAEASRLRVDETLRYSPNPDCDGGRVTIAPGGYEYADARNDSFGAYIAAASPNVVLGLLNRLEAAEAALRLAQTQGELT